MIKKLRRKIFWSIELSAIGVLFLILFVYNVIQYAQGQKAEWQMLSLAMEKLYDFPVSFYGSADGKAIEDTGGIGKMQPGGRREKGRPLKGRDTATIVNNLISGEIGLVALDEKENIRIVSGFLQDYEESEKNSLIKKIVSRQKEKGTTGGIKYLLRSGEEETWIVLLDAGYIDKDVLQMTGISFSGLILASALFGIFAHQLSARIVRPIEETLLTQKQFIADASHELKTPVAVISANTSVLEKETGQSRWLNYIKEENRRMSELINQLLKLSRLDYEKDQKVPQAEYKEYNLSDTILEAALPFESIAFEKGIDYELHVPENLTAYGISEDLRQIIGILLDNALKHTEDKGMVTLSAEEKIRQKKP